MIKYLMSAENGRREQLMSVYRKGYWLFTYFSLFIAFPRDLEICQSAWLKLTCRCLMTQNKKEHLQALFCQSETFEPVLVLASCIRSSERYVTEGNPQLPPCALQLSSHKREVHFGGSLLFTVGILAVQDIRCLASVFFQDEGEGS